MTAHFGNPLAEQRALRAGSAVVLLPDAEVVAVSGADRLSWLDSMTSQALGGLAAGQSAETLLLDPSGRIEQVIRVLDDGTTAWLLLDAGRGAALAAFLDRMRFLLRVEVAVRSGEFVTLAALGDGGASDALAALAAAPAGVPLRWVDPWPGVVAGGVGYAAGGAGEADSDADAGAGDAPGAAAHPGRDWRLTLTLVPAERRADAEALPQAGELALEALRIAAWRPSVAELDATSIPHELDWLRTAVHLDKGCYRGQETVAKVHNLGHPPRRLTMLHLDGSDNVFAAAGDAVLAAGAEVGRVTSAGIHFEDGPLALAVLRRSVDPDAPLTVVASGGEVAASQEVIVPPDAGRSVEVPRLARLGGARRER